MTNAENTEKAPTPKVDAKSTEKPKEKAAPAAETPKGVDLGTINLKAVEPRVEPEVPFVNKLGFWSETGKLPKKATAGSAAFDIQAYLPISREIQISSPVASTRRVKPSSRVFLEPGERALIPTGLFADIPEGYVLKLHARSGLSFKEGLILTNGVAVIDSDYVEEIFVSLTNNSEKRVSIENGDRIAQGILEKVEEYDIVELSGKPQTKTTRTGGFGSTGV